jgi:hypothetical protein
VPFIDRFEKMPVHADVKSNVWGRDFVVPRDPDNGIEHPEWCYWGGDVIKGPDGLYHKPKLCRDHVKFLV